MVINATISQNPKLYFKINAHQTIKSLLELLCMAQHAPKTHKGAYLIKSQAHLDILNLELRLYLELKLVNETKIFQLLSELQEVGRMLGGWLRANS